MIKRSFVWLLAAYCVGILCKDRQNAVLLSVFIIYTFFAVAMVFKPVIRRLVMKGNRVVILLPLFFMLGTLLASYQGRDYKIDNYLANTKTGKAEGRLYGNVVSVNRTENGYKIELNRTEINIEGNIFREGRVLLWSEYADDIKIGNRIAVFGTAKQLTPADNPGQFDEMSYYRAKNIACRFTADNYVVYEKDEKVIREAVRRLRERLSATCDRIFPEEESGIVKSVLLGDKSTLSEDTRELYQNNGIGHILAISGLHVSLLGYGLFELLRKMKMPLVPASVFTIILLLFYGILTGFGISTIRAVGALSMAFIGRMIGRRSDSRQTTAMFGLIILLFRPLELYQISFQLSFAAALGIATFSNEFAKWNEGNRYTFRARLADSLLSGISPQLVTIPLILNTYYEIPVYSFLLNLIILPFLSLLVVLAGVVILIAEVCMPLATFIAGGAYRILWLYKLLCNLFLKLPSPLFLYGNPGRVRLILCYCVIALFFILAGVIGKNAVRKGRKSAERRYAALVLLLLPLVFIRGKQSSLKLASLSVGQGDCMVIQTSHESGIILDCGSSSVSEVYKYRVKPFLKYSGISTIDAIILTHPDADHINGAAELLENSETGGFYAGNVAVRRLIMTRASYESEKMRDIVELAKEKNVEIVLFSAGDVLETGDLKLTCLSPWPENDTADNDGSLVFLASFGRFDGLMMGDSSGAGEEAVYAAERAGLIDFPVEFLKVSHHGSKSASSEDFINEFRPVVSILSYGRGNVYGHPNAKVVARLEDVDSRLYMTGQSGAACFVIRRE